MARPLLKGCFELLPATLPLRQTICKGLPKVRPILRRSISLSQLVVKPFTTFGKGWGQALRCVARIAWHESNPLLASSLTVAAARRLGELRSRTNPRRRFPNSAGAGGRESCCHGRLRSGVPPCRPCARRTI